MLGRREARPDVGRLTHAKPGPIDLTGLMLVQLQAARELARIHGEFRKRSLVGPPRFHGRGHLRPFVLQATVRVQQFALPALVQQPLLIVLAVDLHEASGHVRQSRGRDRLVVDACGGSARS